MASLVWVASDYSCNIPRRKHHWSTSAASHLAQSQKQPRQSWSASNITNNDCQPRNGSAQVNDYQPYGYSHQNDISKQQLSPNGSRRPCIQLWVPPSDGRVTTYTSTEPPKANAYNNQCSPSTHVVLSRQHWTITNSPTPYRTTNAVSYIMPRL